MSTEVFSASTSDVRPLASVLRSLSFKKSQKAVVQIRGDGMKVTVEEGRSIQANAYLHFSSFKSYTYDPPLPSEESQAQIDQLADEGEEEDERISAFQINLSTMMECLNIFGNAGSNGSNSFSSSNASSGGRGGGEEGSSNRFRRNERDEELGGTADGKVTSLRMSYSGYGTPLILLLEEEGIVTRCEITTYEPESLMELPFYDENKIQRLIMKSGWLRDAFLEMDSSSEKVTMIFSPAVYNPTPYNHRFKKSLASGRNRKKKGKGKEREGNDDAGEDEDDEAMPTFRLETEGNLGSSEMDYPNDRDVLEIFECEHFCKNSYKFSHIQLTTKALIASTKTSIRTSAEGLLSFQFMIPLAKSRPANKPGAAAENKDAFVEFLCVPLDD